MNEGPWDIIPGPASKMNHQERLAKILQKLDIQREIRQLLIENVANLDNIIVKTKLKYAQTSNEHSPILCVPVELTSSIFRLVAGNNEDSRHTLSHVCHSWRSISLSLPELWTSFRYSGRPSDLDRITAHIERSGNRVLDLYFTIVPRQGPWRGVLEKAMGQVFRWRSLILQFYPEGFQDRQDLLSEIFSQQLSAPNLEVLEVIIDARMEYEIPFALPARPYFLGRAPKLSRSRFDSWSLKACMPISNVTVTTLDIIHPLWTPAKYPFRVFLDILMSTRLVNLSLSGDIFYLPYQDVPVVAPGLKNLRLAKCHDLASRIFNYFQAPNLELLILVDIDIDEHWTFPLGINLTNGIVPVPFPSLRSIAFILCNTDFLCVSRLAQLTKNVTDLYVVQDLNRVPNINLCREMMKAPEANIWPGLEALFCRLNGLIGDDRHFGGLTDEKRDLEGLLGIVTWRLENLNKQCVLKLQDKDAKAWEEHHPKTWKQLTDKGLFEEWVAPDDTDFVPWPARSTESIESRRMWEDRFLSVLAERE